MIKVHSEVQIYAIDDKETLGLPLPTVGVDSHPRFGFIELEIAGHKYRVVAEQLILAVNNAKNDR